MRSLFPSSYDRADVLMSAGCSTFVSAALILVIPRVGIVLLEILLGVFFIGCALVARVRLRILARSKVKEGPEGSTNAKAKWFDRYDVLMILAVIVIYSSVSGLLRHARLVGRHRGYLAAHPVCSGNPAEAARRGVSRKAQGRIGQAETHDGRAHVDAGEKRRSQERKRTNDASQRSRNDCRFEDFSTLPPAKEGARGPRRTPNRRRARGRQRGGGAIGKTSSKPNGEERFFLASGSATETCRRSGRECASEAEAIIDAFRER